MTIYTHYWLRLLLWVFIGLGVLSGVTIVIKERMKDLLEKGKLGNGWKRNFLVITGERVTRQVSKIVVFALGLFVGYAVRSYQFNTSRYLYTDVLVIERHDDKNFTLQPARMSSWEATTCSAVDWKKGQKMKYLMYQQQKGCKDVTARGAYEFYVEHGKRKNYEQEILNAGN